MSDCNDNFRMLFSFLLKGRFKIIEYELKSVYESEDGITFALREATDRYVCLLL